MFRDMRLTGARARVETNNAKLVYEHPSTLCLYICLYISISGLTLIVASEIVTELIFDHSVHGCAYLWTPLVVAILSALAAGLVSVGQGREEDMLFLVGKDLKRVVIVISPRITLFGGFMVIMVMVILSF